MTVVLKTVRKLTSGATQAQARADLEQLFVDAGGVIYDEYTSGGVFYFVVQHTFPGYASPLYSNWSVTVGLNFSGAGISSGWNTATHTPVNVYIFNTATYAVAANWSSTRSNFAQAVVGAGWFQIAFSYDPTPGVALPNIATATLNDAGLRFYTAETVPANWSADLPYPVIAGASSSFGQAISPGGASHQMPYPNTTVINQMYTGDTLQFTSSTARSMADGRRPLVAGRLIAGADGQLIRVGAADLAYLMTSALDVSRFRNPIMGDRLVVTAGVEEYAIGYGGTSPTATTYAELWRTV